MLSAPAVQFKGSGWYVTDYAKKSGAPASDSGSKETKKESKTETAAKESPSKKADKSK